LAAATTIVSGCASAPEPTAELVAARQAVSEAERAQAVEHAAEVMTESRTKLALAEAAVKERNMEQAARLADEARIDAELATAQAAAAKAQAANDEMRRSTQTLIEEMQRNNAGGTP
jgi:PBP1b-binding outer membrane lipoprotein LpoB